MILSRPIYILSICTGYLFISTLSFTAGFTGKDEQRDTTYQLAFANFGPVNTDIYIADADGSHIKPFLPDPSPDYNASFSRDGRWIIFTSERNGTADIYRAHPDGTGLEQLTNDNAFDDQAVFSPDGKKIAFVSTRNRQADIYVMDIASRRTINITNHPGGDLRPSWSPDGQWLAFSSDRDSKNPRPNFVTWHSTEIFTIKADGGSLTKRTNKGAYAGSPCWSPDGKKLVFYEAELQQVNNMNTVIRKSAVTQLSVVDLTDQSAHTITTDAGEKTYPKWLTEDKIGYLTGADKRGLRFTDGTKEVEGDFDAVSWSADGRKIIFHRELTGEKPPFRNLYSRNKKFRLLQTGVFPCFEPSGVNLICNDKTAGIHHNNILRMDMEGKNRTLLFSDSVKSALAPVYSPGGDKIAFGFGRFFQSVQGPSFADIAIINKDGTGLEVLTNGKGNCGFPSWSPDGKKIVYRSATDSLKGLLIIEVATRKITVLTNNSHDNFPVWSPVEDMIAFTSKREGNYDLYIIKTDGTGLRRLTNHWNNEAHSVWSPDGKWIAFSSGMQGFKDEAALHPYNPQPYGEICVMRADGRDIQVLTDNQYEEATPAWRILGK